MTDLSIIGPIGVRKFELAEVCESNAGHQHNYDHVTIVVRGRIKVIYRYEQGGQVVEGESREFGAGETVTIKANVHHTVKSLEANTLYLCVFSHRDFDGQVIQSYRGNDAAYI